MSSFANSKTDWCELWEPEKAVPSGAASGGDARFIHRSDGPPEPAQSVSQPDPVSGRTQTTHGRFQSARARNPPAKRIILLSRSSGRTGCGSCGLSQRNARKGRVRTWGRPRRAGRRHTIATRRAVFHLRDGAREPAASAPAVGGDLRCRPAIGARSMTTSRGSPSMRHFNVSRFGPGEMRKKRLPWTS